MWLDLHRKMPAAKKIAAVFELNELAAKVTEAGVRRMYPQAGEREVFLRTVARRLDREDMIRAYGWNPEAVTADENYRSTRIKADLSTSPANSQEAKTK